MTTRKPNCTRKTSNTVLAKLARIAFLTSLAPFFTFTVFTAEANADGQVGTITQLEGSAQLYTNPSKTLAPGEGGPPRAKFEGEYYRVRDAQSGDRIENGNIVHTSPSGKARIIFPNGDQFNVGPGTSYRVSWTGNESQPGTNVNLMFGKLRGIIEKGGPRSHLIIRTRAAVMGVRGTDFYIRTKGTKEATEVSIIRGIVSVKPEAPKAKPVDVKAGFSGVVAKKKDVDLHQTSKVEYKKIQTASEIEHPSNPAAPLKQDVQKEIAKLEEKATVATLNDIKKTDPTLFDSIKGRKIASIDELNKTAMHELVQKAPETPSKPGLDELEHLEEGAYKKYLRESE